MDRSRFPPGYGALWAAVAVDLLGFGLVLPLLPLYAAELGVDGSGIGVVVASYSLALVVSGPVVGRWSDRVGRRPVLVLALIGSGVGSLVTALAGGFALLVVGRLLDGLSGASVVAARAAIADLAEPDQRPRLFGLLGAAFGLGFVAGPALGGVLAAVDLRLPYLVAATLAAINAVVAWRRVPAGRPRVSSEPAPGTPALWNWLAVVFLAGAAFSAFETTFALLAERRLDLGPTGIGALFAGVGVVIVAVQAGAIGPITRRLGSRSTLRLGLGGVALGLAALGAAASWVTVVVSLAVLTAGQALVGPTLSTLIAESTGQRGAAFGAQQSVGGLARILGPLAAGLVWSELGPASPFVMAAVGTALALGVAPRAELAVSR